ncbi:hypothetical protein [Rhodococcoides trifolii]|uniref:hypothetical protein n=1 Tax=Rhodococcoides trifolii TaxID=908250 RepID=UPI001668843A|nr:hypothetical protein [Rhodococcus trifolii]
MILHTAVSSTQSPTVGTQFVKPISLQRLSMVVYRDQSASRIAGVFDCANEFEPGLLHPAFLAAEVGSSPRHAKSVGAFHLLFAILRQNPEMVVRIERVHRCLTSASGIRGGEP